MADGLPLDCDVVVLAETFGKLPDEVAEGMSEYWYYLSLVFLEERSKSKRGAKSGQRGPAPEPDKDEVDEQGRWFLTG